MVFLSFVCVLAVFLRAFSVRAIHESQPTSKSSLSCVTTGNINGQSVQFTDKIFINPTRDVIIVHKIVLSNVDNATVSLVCDLDGVDMAVTSMIATAGGVNCFGTPPYIQPMGVVLLRSCGRKCWTILSTIAGRDKDDFQVSVHKLGFTESGFVALCQLVFKTPVRPVHIFTWDIADILIIALFAPVLLAYVEFALARFL